MKRVLITGGSGQVGVELGRHRWPSGYAAVSVSSPELDLADPAAIALYVGQGNWAAVVNAGAYTAVDKAETEVVRAWQVNALGPAALAQACRDAAVPLVHISTDYIFNGQKSGAWEVEDTPNPLGVYGASKLGGEHAIQSSGVRHAIVRTSWVVSAHGHNFVRTMLRLGAERDAINVVADQQGCMTSATDLASALAVVTVRMIENTALSSATHHFTNTGITTWAELARAVFDGSRKRGASGATVNDITTENYPTPARRPANSVLSTVAFERDLGITARPWQQALDDILDELIGKKP